MFSKYFQVVYAYHKQNNRMQKLRSFIIAGIIGICALSEPVSASASSFSDTLLYLPVGTGRTTGHVMDLTITNPGGVSVKVNLGPWLIPEKGNYQGYVIPAAYQALIPPLGSVTLSLNGYCTDVFKQALPNGEWGPNFRNWVSAGEGGLIPGPGWSPDSAYQAAVEAPPTALNLSFPGTRKRFPLRIDVHLFPKESANLLIDAVRRLEDGYYRLEAMAKLPSLQGMTSEQKMQTFVQQGLWVFAAQLGGKYYSEADFALQYLEEAEQRFNHLRNIFSPAARQQVALQAEDIWRGVQIVGLEAKVFTPQEVDEDMIMPFQTWLDEQIRRIDPTQGLVAQWAVLKDTLLRVQMALDTSKFDSLRTELNGKFPALADKFLANLKLQKPEKSVNDALDALEFVQSPALNDLPKQWVAQWQDKLKAALGEHYGRALDLIDRADPQATPIVLASFGLFNERVRIFLPNEIRNKTLSKIREKIRPILERDVNAINATNEAAGETIFRLLDALQQSDFIQGLPVKKVTELRQTLEQKKLEYLSVVLGRINATDSTALRRIMALNTLLQSESGRTLPLDSLETWRLRLESKWIVWLDSTIRRIDPNTQSAIRTVLSTLELLHSGWPERLGEDDPAHQAQVTHKLRSWFQGQVERLQPADTTFLSTWRTLADYQSAPWYHANLGAEFRQRMETQMNKLLADFTGRQTGVVQPGMLLNQSLQATGAQWKRTFNPPPAIQEQKNTAQKWLIGAGIGVGIGAGVLIVRNRKGEPSPPPKPQALPDNLTVSCPGSGSVNILANDSGESLLVTALGSVPAGVTTTHTVGGTVQVTTAGFQGAFSFSYTIIDKHQQTASSTVSVTVQDNQAPLLSCPANVAVACGSNVDPVSIGTPVATDACAAPTEIMIAFTDHTGGTPCLPVIQRRWVAADPAGNSATCLQQITRDCDFSATFQVTPSVCIPNTHQYNNGAATITLSPAGSYAIHWSNGATSATITMLTQGAYTATVSSPASGCTKVFQVTIPYQPAFFLNATDIKHPSSPSASDGQITVSVTPPNNAVLPLHVYINGSFYAQIGMYQFTVTQLGTGVYTFRAIESGGAGCPSAPLSVVLKASEPPGLLPGLQWNIAGIAPGLFMNPVLKNMLNAPDIPGRLAAAIPEHPHAALETSRVHLTRLPFSAALALPLGGAFFGQWEARELSGEQWHYLKSPGSTRITTPFTVWSQDLSVRRQSIHQWLPWFAGAGLQYSRTVWGKSIYGGASLGNLIDGKHQWSLYGTAGGRWVLSRYTTLELEGRVQTAFESPIIMGSLALNICWMVR